MNITHNPELFRSLFNAAIALRDLKPWKIMSDPEQVTVRDPATGELGRCQVMGNGGSTFGLAIYRGKLGSANLERTFNLAESGEDPGEDLWGSCLYNSFGLFFVSLDEVEPEDKKLYQALGLKFRGKNNYVQLRNMEPGYIPDLHFTAPQLAFFTHCVEQTLQVARRLLEVPGAGPAPDMDHPDFLVRHPNQTGTQITWEDRYEVLPLVGIMDIVPQPQIDTKLLATTRNQLPRKLKGVCAYLILPIPSVIDEPPRPYAPLVCLMVDGATGKIGRPEAVHYHRFLESFSSLLTEGFKGVGYLPQQLIVVDQITQLILEPFCDLLDIDVILEPDHKGLKSLIDMLVFQTMMSGRM